jgi:type IV pilus assembly protein PilV
VREEKIKSQQGFTLLEVIIAISILAFGLLSVAAMQASALRATAGAYKATEATKRAQDRMELLLSLPYGDGLLSGGSHSDASSSPEYTINWDVEENEPMNNMKKITVTVSWNERGIPRNTVLACLKPRL